MSITIFSADINFFHSFQTNSDIINIEKNTKLNCGEEGMRKQTKRRKKMKDEKESRKRKKYKKSHDEDKPSKKKKRTRSRHDSDVDNEKAKENTIDTLKEDNSSFIESDNANQESSQQVRNLFILHVYCYFDGKWSGCIYVSTEF